MAATCLTRPSTFATRSARALIREALNPRGPLHGCIVSEPEEVALEDKRGRIVDVGLVSTVYDRRTFKAVGQVQGGVVTWYATAPPSPSEKVDPKAHAVIRRRRREGPAEPPHVVATDAWPHRKP